MAWRCNVEKKAYPDIPLLIGGVWRDAPSSIPIHDPSTGQVIGHAPRASRADLEDAVAAAVAGFGVWRAMAPADRCRLMLEAVRLIRERREAISRVMTLEQGKPLDQSLVEVERSCAILEWDANEGLRAYGRVIPSAVGISHAVIRQPLGPVAAFSPWNFPASAPARKIGGALAAGCSVILKPSEETPGTAALMARAFQDAGLPEGVLNLVCGDPEEISSFLIPHPAIRLVTFTGSVPVGKKLAALAGAHMKPVVMELGGHGPVIVCGDADPVRAATLCATAKARNAGQVCVSPTRFLVDHSIHDAFVDTFVQRANALRIGNGLDPGVQMGPLANPRRVAAMDALVADAVARGARLAAGGQRIGNRGNFYPLTVLTDIPEGAECLAAEPFGPLALILRTRHLDEAIARANSLPFGLAAYAFTDSARTMDRLAAEVECGNLAINHLTASFPETPFGGVKESGYGREGGTEGLDFYMSTKLVSVARA